MFPPLEAGSDDEIVSKILWKSWKSCAKSNKNGRPKINEELHWPEFTSGQPDDVIGVEITRNPIVRSLAQNVSSNFWDSIKSEDKLSNDDSLESLESLDSLDSLDPNYNDVTAKDDSQKSITYVPSKSKL